MKKVVLFGGSFNPPHIGHKKLIELVRDSFSCDEIWLLPSGDRRDKTIEIEPQHRIQMAHLFAQTIQKEDRPKIIVSEHEVKKVNKTATIETLEELSRLYPENEFYLIVSSELVPAIKKTWVRGQELFETARFIIIERPGSHSITEIELPPLSTIIHPNSPLPEMSSTIVRGIREINQLYDVVGFEIGTYIVKNKLYGFQ